MRIFIPQYKIVKYGCITIIDLIDLIDILPLPRCACQIGVFPGQTIIWMYSLSLSLSLSLSFSILICVSLFLSLPLLFTLSLIISLNGRQIRGKINCKQEVKKYRS